MTSVHRPERTSTIQVGARSGKTAPYFHVVRHLLCSNPHHPQVLEFWKFRPMSYAETPAVRTAGLRRRTFLQGAALSVPAVSALAGRALPAADGSPAGYPRVITRQVNPDNIEFAFPTLDSFLTPNEQFYIRSHFNVPELTAGEWKLRVEGHVERPFEIGFDELRKLETRTETALLECAGNGRVLLQPLQAGLRWEQGGVSNAEWTGVPLALLLDRAGVKQGAVEVILEGYDMGRVGPPSPASAGEISFARSLPLAKARQPNVLLAWEMNGEELTPRHGFPVRAVVPGWYGMASIKWLKRIVVTDRAYQGYFQTFAYTVWERPIDGLPTLVAVGELDVKSQIARPAALEIVAAGSTYHVIGAAWAGEPEISRVDVSTDGGQTWSPARLDEKSVPNAWRFFHFDWNTSKTPGRHVLMSRGTDARGRTQPMTHNPDRRDAMITFVQPIEVIVR
jgi:DMSO/TMAO reductase YedYZ molybdopterin-dependent catalytic subunit